MPYEPIFVGDGDCLPCIDYPPLLRDACGKTSVARTVFWGQSPNYHCYTPTHPLYMGKKGSICRFSAVLCLLACENTALESFFLLAFEVHKKGRHNDTFRAVFPSIWVPWDPQGIARAQTESDRETGKERRRQSENAVMNVGRRDVE